MDVQATWWQDLYEAGKFKRSTTTCRCDVLDTYFVFLRSRVIVGQLTLDRGARNRRRNENLLTNAHP